MKKYFKKSLSLFMAALMLMSCWVFFAPTKAEAASAGNYTLTISINVSNDREKSGGHSTMQVYYKPNNGTGSETSKTYDLYSPTNYFSSEGDKTVTLSVPGFPTKIYSQLKSPTWDIVAYTKKEVKINGVSAWTGSNELSSNGGFSPGNKTDTINLNATAPKASSVSFNMGTQEVNVPAWGGTNYTKSITATVKDQYGVNWYQSPASWSIGTTSAATQGYDGASLSATGAVDSTTLTVTPEAQKTNKSATNYKKTLYVKATRGSATGVLQFNLANPEYTWRYYSNNPNTNAAVTVNRNGTTNWSDSTTTGSYTETKRYYYLPTIYPTNATRAGYIFKGFYSSKNAISYKSEANALSPSGTKFSVTNTVANGANNPPLTYYAAWQAKDVKVTLVDNGGNVVASYTGKYDQPLQYVIDNNGAAAIPTDVAFDRQSSTGSFEYKFNGKWKVIDAKQYNSDGTQSAYSDAYGNGISYVLKGDTVFQAQYDMKKNSYTVNYLDVNGKQIQSKAYNYRDNAVYEGTAPTKAADNYFTYAFKGWHKVESGEATKDYIVNADGFLSTGTTYDADEGNKYIDTVEDFTVRADATYAPVFEKTFIEYTVNFNYKDALGNDVVTEKVNYHYNEALTVPEVPESYTFGGYRYPFIGWNTVDGRLPVGANESRTYYALYDNGIPAQYTVEFNYKNTDGEDQYNKITVAHDETFTAPTPAIKYRDNDYEYTFTGWLDQYGEGLDTTGKKDAVYTAQYAKSKLYTVTFMNEGEQFGETAKYVKGEKINLPQTPTKDADVIASEYVFKGWVDQNKNAPSVMGEEDLVFEAQYEPKYIDYTVKFVWMDKNGVQQTKETKYHYGDEVAIPDIDDSYQDDVYQYTFKAWDNDVLMHCTENVTYTATYRRAYVYYTIVFKKEVLNEDGTIGYEDYLTDSFIYGERIRIPVVAPAPAILNPNGDLNQTNVLSGWKWKYESDGEGGTLVDYKNGDKITSNMVFYPVYTPAKSIKTVTFLDEDGKKISTIDVEYGTTIEGKYSEPKKAYTDATHFVFDGWLLNGAKFDSSTEITEDITLIANYKEEAHKFTMGTPDVYPTFFETGLGTELCECGKTNPDVVIDKIPDHVAPTAQLYVKDQIITTGENVDMSKALLVAPSSNLILATDDKAEKSTYNETGKGVGTGRIEYFVSKGTDLVSYDAISDWKLRFDYDEYKEYLMDESDKAGLGRVLTPEQEAMLKEFETNTSAYVGDLTDEYDIQNGDTFIFYAKVIDRLGNTSYIHSGVLTYDDQAPVITLKGDGNGNTKFCEEFTATAKDETKLVSLTVDGEKVEIDEDGVATVSKNTAGTYQIIATDEAGNTTLMNVTVVGEHKTRVYTTVKTCESDGHIVTVCTVCNKVLSDETDKTDGHDWVDVETVEPTCEKDGYTLQRCSKCAKTQKANPVEATGKHTFGDWKEITAANCSNEGKKIRVCSVCQYTETEIIPIDENVHKWARAVVTKPTCTEGGYSTKTCKLCGTTETFDKTEALGHTPSDEWTVKKPAKCEEEGTKVKYCARCGEASGILASETIPAAGHSWAWKKTVKPTGTEKGYTLYVCMICGAERKDNYVDKLVNTTITFFNEDGKTELYKFEKTEGDTITSADVTEPKKDADAKYKYTFSHWENIETKEKVNLPIVAGKNDISVKAVFNAIEKKFTITLYNEDGSQFNKVGYRTYGEVYTITNSAAEPKKAETATATYEFAGWIVKGSGDNTKASKSITVTKDESYVAVFTEKAKIFNVTFAYNYNDIIEQYEVTAGTTLTKPTEDPKKAADENYHYDFVQWNVRDGKIGEAVTADVLAIAEFTANTHDFKPGKVTKEPTCTETGLRIDECVCGRTIEVVLPAKGHEWSDYDENGIRKCLVCGATESRDDTYTVSFMVEGAEKAFKVFSGIKYNATVSSVPTAEKKDTVYKTYTFVKWYKQGDETKTAVSVDEIKAAKVTANVVYVAVFEEADRYYNVFYAIDAQHVLKTYNVKAGDPLPAYDGETPTVDRYDSTTHQVFDRWADTADDYPNGVIQDLYILAKFKSEEHTFKYKSMKGATCTEPMKETFKCTGCSATYEKTEGKALGHNWVLVETVEPSGEKAGYRLYKCDRAGCGETKKEEIGAKTMVDLIVTVTDQNGKPISGAKVSVFDGTTLVGTKTTGSDGIAIFRVEAGKKYRIVVEYNGNHLEDDVTVNPDGSTSGGGNFNINIPHCSCTCHRDGVWPAIFRFFHKIIKMLVGHFVCCGDPDARYGS